MADGALHIGLGNPLRKDDGVGPWISRRLRMRGLRARDWAGDGAGLIDLFGVEKSVVLIDATRSGHAPGSIIRINPETDVIPRPLFHCSTHEFGLAEAVEVARRLGCLPRHLLVLGIEGANFGDGSGLSAPVEKSARKLEAELCRSSGSAPAARPMPPG